MKTYKKLCTQKKMILNNYMYKWKLEFCEKGEYVEGKSWGKCIGPWGNHDCCRHAEMTWWGNHDCCRHAEMTWWGNHDCCRHAKMSLWGNHDCCRRPEMSLWGNHDCCRHAEMTWWGNYNCCKMPRDVTVRESWLL